VIDGIQSRTDLDTRRAYLTDQGLKVVTYMLDNQKGPSTAKKIEFQPHQARGKTCYFPFTQGTDAGYFEFHQQDVWRFHDIVVTRHRGRNVELSLAYTIDHPILAALNNADWGGMFENFLQGLMIGMSLGSR
jgi:hypothetical protein